MGLKETFTFHSKENDEDYKPNEAEQMEVDSDENYDDLDEKGDSQPKKKMGRPLKPFKKNGKQQQRIKLKQHYKSNVAGATALDIDFDVLLGRLMKMDIYNDTKNPPDKDRLALAECLINGQNPMKDKKMEVEKGMYLSENVVYGEEKWDKLKTAMDPLGNKVTTNYALRKYRKEFYPKTG